MARTFDEKLKYNEGRKTPFSVGYSIGAKFYREYPQADSKEKKVINEAIQSCKELARKGDETGKGVLCAMRDAAKARKERQRR